jgi:hypothetical protein
MVGYGAGAHGGVWAAKDAPMKLHLFEYIVHGALLEWWEPMLLLLKSRFKKLVRKLHTNQLPN